MKAFRCGDVVPGCLQEFVGADREAVLHQVTEHARRDHGIPVDDAVREALAGAVEAQLREQ